MIARAVAVSLGWFGVVAWLDLPSSMWLMASRSRPSTRGATVGQPDAELLSVAWPSSGVAETACGRCT
jgi:hypothetical protein